MEIWRYWKRILRTVLRETFSISFKKILRGTVIAVIAALLQYYLFALRNWTDTQKIVGSLVGAAITVIVLEFLWQVIRTPADLHQKQNQEIHAKAAAQKHYTKRMEHMEQQIAKPKQ